MCVCVWTSQAKLILDNTWMIDVRSLGQAIFGFGDRKSEKSTIGNKTQSVYCKYCQWMHFTPVFLKEKYCWQSHLFVYHFYTYILKRIFNNFKIYFYRYTFLIWRFFIGVLFNKKSPKQNDLIIGASGNSLSIFYFLNLFETTVDSHVVVQNRVIPWIFHSVSPKA